MNDLNRSESFINELDMSAIFKCLFNHIAKKVKLWWLIVNGLHCVEPVDHLIQLFVELFGLVTNLIILTAHIEGFNFLAQSVQSLIDIHEPV
jgi:hypothetical protein